MKASRLLVAGLASVVVVGLFVGYMVAQEGSAAKEAPPARDVVIVWCGGTPGAPALPPLEAGAVDAVTQSTPAEGNVKEIAQKLGKELEAAGHSVLVIAAEDCRDPRQIVQAKALVLGCRLLRAPALADGAVLRRDAVSHLSRPGPLERPRGHCLRYHQGLSGHPARCA